MSMEIVTLPLGDYQTNCYLVADGAGICAVIDPGYSPEAVLSEAARRRWQIRAVLLTHGHFDHVGGVRGIAEATDCPVYLHENDRSLPPWLTAGMPDDTQAIKEGDMICVGELRFSVLETPGHRRAPSACAAATLCSPGIPFLPAPAAERIWAETGLT